MLMGVARGCGTSADCQSGMLCQCGGASSRRSLKQRVRTRGWRGAGRRMEGEEELAHAHGETEEHGRRLFGAPRRSTCSCTPAPSPPLPPPAAPPPPPSAPIHHQVSFNGDCGGNDAGGHGFLPTLDACEARCQSQSGCNYYCWWAGQVPNSGTTCYPKTSCSSQSGGTTSGGQPILCYQL